MAEWHINPCHACEDLIFNGIAIDGANNESDKS